jgi:hypothetical protein
MLYDSSALMKCQVKKYSGLNFARKIRNVTPDVSSKIWYCGTSIGLTYDGLIASANFCRNRFCPTCQLLLMELLIASRRFRASLSAVLTELLILLRAVKISCAWSASKLGGMSDKLIDSV